MEDKDFLSPCGLSIILCEGMDFKALQVGELLRLTSGLIFKYLRKEPTKGIGTMCFLERGPVIFVTQIWRVLINPREEIQVSNSIQLQKPHAHNLIGRFLIGLGAKWRCVSIQTVQLVPLNS